MTNIEFTAEVLIGGKPVQGISVSPLFYEAFAQLTEKVLPRVTATEKFETLLRRERIRHQVVFTVDGKRALPDQQDIMSFPVSVGKKIVAALDIGEGKGGEVIGDGDGVSKPILYKLGTPIAMKGSKSGDVVIDELEFVAKTFGDIEDVLSENNVVSQALALIRRARPVNSETLHVLPTWAIAQIRNGDGVTIGSSVLPRFLG